MVHLLADGETVRFHPIVYNGILPFSGLPYPQLVFKDSPHTAEINRRKIITH
jgi:hypothetical protein